MKFKCCMQNCVCWVVYGESGMEAMGGGGGGGFCIWKEEKLKTCVEFES